ncbi:hypothetical protein FBUS_03074 [Fasciolopsis buskii]|uniref:G-protein coupled receptors family 1 profile domain-containing protein n=1 Tax=Fasciolopsis buskii TaxID=27845 RepID=A0A8E0RUW0_9TREM|nr:hypothetical protein FBUS_03074 [Fasciolopsis buski]
MVDSTFNPNQTPNFALGMGCSIPLCVGMAANIFLFYALLSVKIESRLTKLLLRTQAATDMLSCFWNTVFIWIRNFPYTSHVVGWIHCHVWRTQTPYWLVTASSTYNLTFILLNRIWATVYCATYRRYEKAYIICTMFTNITLSILVVSPGPFIVIFENMTCITQITPNQQIVYRLALIYQPFWCVVYYLMPIAIMLVAHIRLVFYFGSEELKTQGEEHQIQPNNWSISVNVQSEPLSEEPAELPPFVDPLHRSMSIGSFCMICFMFLAHTYDTINFLLPSLVSSYFYDYGSDTQLISLFISTANTIANPVIIILSVPCIRTFLFTSLTARSRHLKRTIRQLFSWDKRS